MKTLDDWRYEWDRARTRRRLRREGHYAPTFRAAKAMAARDGHEWAALSASKQRDYWRWASAALDSIFERDQ